MTFTEPDFGALVPHMGNSRKMGAHPYTPQNATQSCLENAKWHPHAPIYELRWLFLVWASATGALVSVLAFFKLGLCVDVIFPITNNLARVEHPSLSYL